MSSSTDSSSRSPLAIVSDLGHGGVSRQALGRRSTRGRCARDNDIRGQAAARAALAQARRILGRAAWRAFLLVSLLFAGVTLLNDLAAMR